MEKIDEISKKFSQSFREFPNQEKFDDRSLSMNEEVEEPPEDAEDAISQDLESKEYDDDKEESSQKVFSKPSENLSQQTVKTLNKQQLYM